VINEHRPYYAYEDLGKEDSWLRRKLGFLYFRLVNWRQPHWVIDQVGMSQYILAGCRKAKIVDDSTPIELAILSKAEQVLSLISDCNDRSIIIVDSLQKQRSQWKKVIENQHITISYDLYYCGILLFDSKRSKQNYKINF